jgi:hypothetical protein
MSVHPVLEYVAGDDWEIRATLLDETGKPYDLSGSPIIKWILFDAAHNHIVDNEAIITIVDPTAGIVSIIITAVTTARIGGGRYSDALRVTIADSTSTLSMGTVRVISNPTAEPIERFGRFDITDMAR